MSSKTEWTNTHRDFTAPISVNKTSLFLKSYYFLKLEYSFRIQVLCQILISHRHSENCLVSFPLFSRLLLYCSISAMLQRKWASWLDSFYHCLEVLCRRDRMPASFIHIPFYTAAQLRAMGCLTSFSSDRTTEHRDWKGKKHSSCCGRETWPLQTAVT